MHISPRGSCSIILGLGWLQSEAPEAQVTLEKDLKKIKLITNHIKNMALSIKILFFGGVGGSVKQMLAGLTSTSSFLFVLRIHETIFGKIAIKCHKE